MPLPTTGVGMLAGLSLRGAIVAPQERTRVGVHGHEALVEERDVLPDVAHLCNGDGRVGGGLAAEQRRQQATRCRGSPDHGTRPLVQRDKRRLPARRDDELVAIDERRFRIGPRARHAAEVGAQALLPFHRAGLDVERHQVAVRPQRIQACRRRWSAWTARRDTRAAGRRCRRGRSLVDHTVLPSATFSALTNSFCIPSLAMM